MNLFIFCPIGTGDSKVKFFFSFTSFTASCGGYLNGNNGTFTSPNYPNNYGNNRQCSWIIEVPEYHKIELTFQNFSIEEGFDFVEVFDGKTLASKSFGKFNNNQKPTVITSTANTMRVTLISDISNSFEGFLAKYKASKLILLQFFDYVLHSLFCFYNCSMKLLLYASISSNFLKAAFHKFYLFHS